MPVKGYRGPRVTVVREVCGKIEAVTPAHAGRRFCSRACKVESQRRYSYDVTDADVARFWAKVDRSGGPDACWPWMVSTSTNGYGQIRWRGKRATAHRIAYELANGIPLVDDGCHRCDNPPCCNPAHIFDGTALDNMRDRVAKGRMDLGSLRASSVLNEAAVAEILRDRVPGTYSRGYAAIARRHGVTPGAVRCIFVGKTWRHVSGLPYRNTG